jgi:hypothetical protein
MPYRSFPHWSAQGKGKTGGELLWFLMILFNNMLLADDRYL